MTVVDVRDHDVPTVATEAPAVEERIRPRALRPLDVGLFAGSVLAGGALAWLVFFRLTPMGGGLGFVLGWWVASLFVYRTVVHRHLGRQAATDRVMAVVVGSAAVGLFVPLVLILFFVLQKGITALNWGFFTETLEFTGPLSPADEGGALHAIVGTLQQVGIAVVCSVPLGIMTAVYLNEVRGRLRRPLRAVVEAMSGVPSIVAGLFIYAMIVANRGSIPVIGTAVSWLPFSGRFSGVAAGLALSVLMLPTVTRTAEEMLRLVPGGLREASLALGAPEWRTALRVVLPTARIGLVTAVILGVARAIGETAPLLLTAFGSASLETNPLEEQSSLPLFVYQQIRSPEQAQIDRAWTGALVLILMVLILFSVARFVGARSKVARR